eukprot:PLAT9978.1.p1 GENE.PLAT9978.1~~PLAT9978.1.p1  ORF type:complete len:1778 (+),score=904.81 PLAT9978.1:564-5336(+)
MRGCVAIAAPAAPAPLVLQLQAAQQVHAGVSMQAEAVIISGGALRMPTLTWTLTAIDDSPAPDGAAFAAAVAAASGSSTLTLSSAVLPTAGGNYTLSLSGVSALGSATAAAVSQRIQVVAGPALADDAYLPSLRLLGAAALSVRRSDAVELTVDTRPPGQALLPCNSTGSDDVLLQWTVDDDAIAASLLPEPGSRTLLLPAFSLDACAVVTLRARLSSPSGAWSALQAAVTLTVVPGELTVDIAGGDRQQATREQLSLDGRATSDPDELPDRPLEASWTCTLSGSPCLTSTGFSLDLSLYSLGALLSIPPDTLLPGAYLFQLTVRQRDLPACYAARSVSRTVTVSLLASALPTASTTAISPQRVTAATAVDFGGAVRDSRFTAFPRWAVTSASAPLPLGEPVTSSPNETALTLSAAALAPLPGLEYTLRLSAVDSSGATGWVALQLVTNAAPAGGSLLVASDDSPVLAGRSAVMLRAVLWADEAQDLPLTYLFGYTQGGSTDFVPLQPLATQTSQLTTALPPSDALLAAVRVADALGATAEGTAASSLAVQAASSRADALQLAADAAGCWNTSTAAMPLLAAATTTLNELPSEPCALSSEGADCVAVRSARAALLQAVVEVEDTLPETAEALALRATALAAISARPRELSCDSRAQLDLQLPAMLLQLAQSSSTAQALAAQMADLLALLESLAQDVLAECSDGSAAFDLSDRLNGILTLLMLSRTVGDAPQLLQSSHMRVASWRSRPATLSGSDWLLPLTSQAGDAGDSAESSLTALQLPASSSSRDFTDEPVSLPDGVVAPAVRFPAPLFTLSDFRVGVHADIIAARFQRQPFAWAETSLAMQDAVMFLQVRDDGATPVTRSSQQPAVALLSMGTQPLTAAASSYKCQQWDADGSRWTPSGVQTLVGAGSNATHSDITCQLNSLTSTSFVGLRRCAAPPTLTSDDITTVPDTLELDESTPGVLRWTMRSFPAGFDSVAMEVQTADATAESVLVLSGGPFTFRLDDHTDTRQVSIEVERRTALKTQRLIATIRLIATVTDVCGNAAATVQLATTRITIPKQDLEGTSNLSDLLWVVIGLAIAVVLFLIARAIMRRRKGKVADAATAAAEEGRHRGLVGVATSAAPLEVELMDEPLSPRHNSVVIVYDRRDLPFVRKLASWLTEHADYIRLVMEPSVENPMSWRITNERDLLSAAAVVYVMSPHSVKSTYCQEQIFFANYLLKPVVPIIAKDCSRPLHEAVVFAAVVHNYTWVNFYGEEFASAAHDLLDALARDMLEDGTQRVPRPPETVPAPGDERPSMLLIIAHERELELAQRMEGDITRSGVQVAVHTTTGDAARLDLLRRQLSIVNRCDAIVLLLSESYAQCDPEEVRYAFEVRKPLVVAVLDPGIDEHLPPSLLLLLEMLALVDMDRDDYASGFEEIAMTLDLPDSARKPAPVRRGSTFGGSARHVTSLLALAREGDESARGGVGFGAVAIAAKTAMDMGGSSAAPGGVAKVSIVRRLSRQETGLESAMRARLRGSVTALTAMRRLSGGFRRGSASGGHEAVIAEVAGDDEGDDTRDYSDEDEDGVVSDDDDEGEDGDELRTAEGV